MKLDDAFKESPIQAAKRAEGKYEIFIRHLPDNEGFLLRRLLLISNNTPQLIELKVFPHLGALLNHALKEGYKEAKRYAKDWQPMSHLDKVKAQNQKHLTSKGAYSKKEQVVVLNEDSIFQGPEFADYRVYDEKGRRLDIVKGSDGYSYKNGHQLDAEGYFYINPEDADDYDPEEDMIYGLDGRVEYDGRYDDDNDD